MSKTNQYNLFLKKLCEKNKNIQPTISLEIETKEKDKTNEKKGSVLEEELEMIKQMLKMMEESYANFNHESVMFTGKLRDDNKESDEKEEVKKSKSSREKKREKTKTLFEEKEFTQESVPVTVKNIEKKHINKEIQNIQDLLTLIEENPLDELIEYNINMQMLHQIKEPLVELNSMIGMQDVKSSVVHQILYFMQNLHKNEKNQEVGDFMHTVIYGPPGTGKTEIAKIIGRLYSKMGILKKGVFKKVTRADLVASYLGQTATKTRDVILECLGGVLFIDEAYALGNSEKKDSFSKECIDTLCEALSDHKDNLMVIIAGYEKELKECFFNYNPGLESRFQWVFYTEKYSAKEMYEIFKKKVETIGWRIHNAEKDEKTKQKEAVSSVWFEKKKDYFAFYGRDIEVLLSKIKVSHGKRVFCLPVEEKKIITAGDLEKGFEMFLNNEEVRKRKDAAFMKEMIASIYV
jgi:SpoVK/Ycf46/Vps4 family AAA+-type ATPase